MPFGEGGNDGAHANIPAHLKPPTGSDYLTIVDISRVHFCRINYCVWPESKPFHMQLLYSSLFPCTIENPWTAFTFAVLDNFIQIIWNVAHPQATIIARSIGLHPTLVLTLFWWVYPSRLGAILSHFFPVGLLQGATQDFSPVATPKVVKVEWICTLTSISKVGWACTVLSSMSIARDQHISCYRSRSCPVRISPHINFWKSLSLFSWKYTRGFIMDGNFKAEHLHDQNSDNQVLLMDGLGFMVSQNPYKHPPNMRWLPLYPVFCPGFFDAFCYAVILLQQPPCG